MIYIHSLNQLNPKTLDIESVPMVRDVKRDFILPLSNEKIKDKFLPFFVFKVDIEAMEKSYSLIQPTMSEVRNLLGKNDSDYEAINLSRALKMLDEISNPLHSNIHFGREVMGWQDNFVDEAVNILNKLPGLRSREEKIEFNNKLNILFSKLLRNREMAFRHDEIIHEAHVERINNLKTMLQNGFFFHVKLEEEMNKVPFFIIKKRLPSEKLAHSERILNNALAIKEGVDKAYEINMNMIKWTVLLYSYIKTVKSFLVSK